MSRWSGFRNAFEGNPQQGSLFDVRAVPSQPVDSPGMQKRSRRKEMVDAMPPTTSLPYHSDPAFGSEFLDEDPAFNATANKIRGRMHTDYGDEYSESEIRAGYSLGGQRRAEMGRSLADDTTVPASALAGLTSVEIGYDSFEADDPTDKFDGEAAHYRGQFKDIRAPRPMPTGTLTHEIGHHVSIAHEKNPRGGSIPAAHGSRVDGAEEGRADAFALTHTAKRDYTYASNAKGSIVETAFTGEQSPYRQAREAAGQPLREWEGGALSPRQFGPEQSAAFDVEEAFAPESEATVQAYTRNEGREVIGWSADAEQNKHMGRTGIHKNEYDPEHEKPFTGANYASMFDDDIVPERHRNDWLDSRRGAEVVRQSWRR